MNKEQVRLISWMYNYCVVEMLDRNDEHTKGDIKKLTEAIERRFPEHSNEITNQFK